MSRQLPRWIQLVALLLALSGCNIVTGEAATSPTDGTENKLNTGDTGQTAVDGGATGGECNCLKEGDWYRFDALSVVTLDNGKHNVIPILNNLWKQDIIGKELNFFFQVQKVTATEVTVQVINGARVNGTKDQVCLLPYTAAQLTHPRAGCALKDSKPSSMNVYAGTEANKKNCAPALKVPHAIEVRNAIMRTEFSSDCSKVIKGEVVEGALAQASLEKTCTCVNPGQGAETCGEVDPSFKGNDCDGCNSKYQNLKTLLQNFGELAWKCEVDGKPAACLVGKYTAVRIDKAPDLCKD